LDKLCRGSRTREINKRERQHKHKHTHTHTHITPHTNKHTHRTQCADTRARAQANHEQHLNTPTCISTTELFDAHLRVQSFKSRVHVCTHLFLSVDETRAIGDKNHSKGRVKKVVLVDRTLLARVRYADSVYSVCILFSTTGDPHSLVQSCSLLLR